MSRIPVGSRVITLHIDDNPRNYTAEALAARKWGVFGVVSKIHDGHGLCYDVKHDDGTSGAYDTDELYVVETAATSVPPRVYRSESDVVKRQLGHYLDEVVDNDTVVKIQMGSLRDAVVLRKAVTSDYTSPPVVLRRTEAVADWANVLLAAALFGVKFGFTVDGGNLRVILEADPDVKHPALKYRT